MIRQIAAVIDDLICWLQEIGERPARALWVFPFAVFVSLWLVTIGVISVRVEHAPRKPPRRPPGVEAACAVDCGALEPVWADAGRGAECLCRPVGC